MKVPYYPGCTLKTRAKDLDASAKASLRALGVEPVEPERWTCCGVVHSLADDDLIRLLGPVRNLMRIRNQGAGKVVTPCAMCYNSLARANLLMKKDGERKRAINLYFEDEQDYGGEVEVVHLLRFLRDEIGFDTLREMVKAPLDGMKVAAYYGCTLLRPAEVAIDSTLRPTILRDLLGALGAKAIDFPADRQCCSSFQIASHPDMAARVASKITDAAAGAGAEVIVTSCPLCDYNLKEGMLNSSKSPAHDDGKAGIKIVYFTELLASALGLQSE
jgi:heterodisulfide reductase subunit B2